MGRCNREFKCTELNVLIYKCTDCVCRVFLIISVNVYHPQTGGYVRFLGEDRNVTWNAISDSQSDQGISSAICHHGDSSDRTISGIWRHYVRSSTGFDRVCPSSGRWYL